MKLGFPAMSLTYYQPTQCNIAEERRPHVRRGGSLRSRTD